MADSKICYTWSGDKKIYEPDLFIAQLNVFSYEYCYKVNPDNSKTLVFGNPTVADKFSSYLPCCGLSINHNIQANGEDHYSSSGTYTKPGNWSPPAGVDGPFDDLYDLNSKYPYYLHTIVWADIIYTWYGGKFDFLYNTNSGQYSYYYGNKK